MRYASAHGGNRVFTLMVERVKRLRAKHFSTTVNCFPPQRLTTRPAVVDADRSLDRAGVRQAGGKDLAPRPPRLLLLGARQPPRRPLGFQDEHETARATMLPSAMVLMRRRWQVTAHTLRGWPDHRSRALTWALRTPARLLAAPTDACEGGRLAECWRNSHVRTCTSASWWAPLSPGPLSPREGVPTKGGPSTPTSRPRNCRSWQPYYLGVGLAVSGAAATP